MAKSIKGQRWIGLGLFVAAILGCSADSAKSRYLLAERLWTDGKYAAAVSEFEKVTSKDPRGKLGLQAMYRAAMTQTLYLAQHTEAIRKLRAFVEAAGETPHSWEAQKEVGEILYSKLERYDQAILHYQDLIRRRPKAPEVPEILFRIAKSQFFLWQFDEAIATYRDLESRFPGTVWAEKAAFEAAVTHYTRGGRGSGNAAEAYQEAMDAYERFLRKFPSSPLVPEARFGIAACLEELDQLDAAYFRYEALRSSYPSPNVIEIKLARIRERKLQRSR